MQLPSLPETTKKIGQAIRRSADILFLAALALSLVLALLIFYRFVYRPIWAPKLLPAAEPAFDAALFQKVVGELEGREAAIARELSNTPQNPFRGGARDALP